MKKFLTFAIIILGLLNCTSKNQAPQEAVKSSETNIKKVSTDGFNSKGYKLMEQKCFICHFAKPDPSKRSSMIAPPMIRVQQHYKPTYPNKEEFITKITAWVSNPSRDKTLMPGAVRKFDVMPKLGYSKDEIKIIAETLYEIDFGDVPKMGMQMNHGKLKLNNNKKWKLNKNTIDLVNEIAKQLEEFRSDNIEQYNQFGKDVFDKAKTILLDTSYTKETFNQLHSFFNEIEEPIHLLMSVNNLNDAKKQQLILINKLNKFNYYFE